MTVEEIKQNTTMNDVLARYGVTVRGQMCCCPIHGERHPSMQIFPDGYKCHACQSHGDIFTFVMEMEHCDFKQAYLLLGGEYKNRGKLARASMNRSFSRRKEIKARSEANEKLLYDNLLGAIDICRWWISHEEPFSDDWCFAQNNLPQLWHVYEQKYIEGERVEEVNVYRKCREIRQRFITV